MKQIALSLFVIASSGAYVWDHAGKLPDNDLTDTQGAANAAEQTALPRVTPLPAADPVLAPAATQPIIPQLDLPRAPAPRATVEAWKDTPATIAAAVPQAAFADSQPEVTQPPPSPPEPGVGLPGANAAPPQTPSFAVTPAVYIPIPQPRPDYPQARVLHTGMKLAAHGYTDGAYTGPSADAYYGIIQIQALIQGGRVTALKVLRYPNDRRTSVNINRQALPMLRDEAISAQSADVDIISGATLTSKAFIQSLGGALRKASS
ncbi:MULTISPECIES: FMN-binding protein [unclassified Mesorhizobium]|uniref:FMN-binding protein n=1 Tax=unclassified Mesorhizobium TaxID=325217 RepID=UPI00112C47CE|nr:MULTISPECIES: FMN-binding protein [unclassified Mesorhizobium]TPK98987.1 FMN-binding protein [Mesorhizobium sp. B2-4-16]TPL73751.1 FMN-binding protein [Mesorhizobium sp. B2-4-3]